MKKFYVQFTASFVATVAIASAIAGFSGCKALEENPQTSQLVVSYATMKYIEAAPSFDQAPRAARVRAVADALATIAKDDAVTIPMLVSYAVSRIPDTVAASDRVLATMLIQLVAQELQKKVGSDTSHVLVRVTEVMKWVSDACNFYAPRAAVARLGDRWRV